MRLNKTKTIDYLANVGSEFAKGILREAINPVFKGIRFFNKNSLDIEDMCERLDITDWVRWKDMSLPYLTGKSIVIAGYASTACYIIDKSF